MTTNEKQNEQPKSVERKELTPQQLQTRKKMVIFPLFFLAFVGCMWLIFVPDTKDEQPTSGFNTDLPTPEQNGIVSDKRDAYIQEEMKRKQQDKMRSLQDFAFELDGGEAAQESEPQVTVYADNRPRYGGRTSGNAFRSSADAYADINRQLGNFYTDTSGENEEQQKEMQARIEELERRLEEEQERKSAQEEHRKIIRDRRPLHERRTNTDAGTCRRAACRHIRQGCRAARQAGTAQRRIAARRTDARFGISGGVRETSQLGVQHSRRGCLGGGA